MSTSIPLMASNMGPVKASSVFSIMCEVGKSSAPLETHHLALAIFRKPM
ncbi:MULTISPECIES: hypothetical protein [Mesorhizobium]